MASRAVLLTVLVLAAVMAIAMAAPSQEDIEKTEEGWKKLRKLWNWGPLAL